MIGARGPERAEGVGLPDALGVVSVNPDTAYLAGLVGDGEELRTVAEVFEPIGAPEGFRRAFAYQLASRYNSHVPAASGARKAGGPHDQAAVTQAERGASEVAPAPDKLREALTEALAALNLAFGLLNRIDGDPLEGCESGPHILRREGAAPVLDAVRNAALKSRAALGLGGA